MIKGTVKFFNAAKGYGFIAPEGESRDVFVHIPALQTVGIQVLNSGDRVSFEIVEGRDGRKAADNLTLLD